MSDKKRGKCQGGCIQYKAHTPVLEEDRYKSVPIRCQTCAIFISENGLEPPPNNPKGDARCCKCCGLEVSKEPRSKKSKKVHQRNLDKDPVAIPQVDDLLKVIDFLKLIGDGIKSRNKIADRLNIPLGQVDHYKDAVKVLELVENKPKLDSENLLLNKIGMDVLNGNTDEILRILKNQIRKIPIYNSMLQIIQDSKVVSKIELLSMFLNKGKLSPTITVKRQFSTFLQWSGYLGLIDKDDDQIVWKDTAQNKFSGGEMSPEQTSGFKIIAEEEEEEDKKHQTNDAKSEFEEIIFTGHESDEELVLKVAELRQQIREMCKKRDLEEGQSDYSFVEMFELLEDYLKLLPNDKRWGSVRNFF